MPFPSVSKDRVLIRGIPPTKIQLHNKTTQTATWNFRWMESAPQSTSRSHTEWETTWEPLYGVFAPRKRVRTTSNREDNCFTSDQHQSHVSRNENPIPVKYLKEGRRNIQEENFRPKDNQCKSYSTSSSSRKRKITSMFEEPSNSKKRMEMRIQRFGKSLDASIVEANMNKIRAKSSDMPEPRREILVNDRKREGAPTLPNSFDLQDSQPERKILRAIRFAQTTRAMRPVVIDGPNVAYEFGNPYVRLKNFVSKRKELVETKKFDCYGIYLCVKYFVGQGCTDITVVIPEAILQNHLIINHKNNREILKKLITEKRLNTACSRLLRNGHWISSYDDRFILELAYQKHAVVVSNDRYRDLWEENPCWRNTISERTLNFRFYEANGVHHVYFPCDPHGRYGKSFKEILELSTTTCKRRG